MKRWCLVLALFACSKEPAKASDHPAGSGTGSGAAPGSAAIVDTPSSVEIFVDDKPVGKIAMPQIGLWPRIDTLVPVSARRLGMWQDVYLKSKAPKPVELHKPSMTYPELVPALFPGDDGSPSFGMFDPVELAKHGKPQLREDSVRELRIRLDQTSGRGQNEQGDGGGMDPMQIKIAVKTPKGEQTIDGPKLLAVPRDPMPGENEPRGWKLSTILKLAGVTSYQRVLLTDQAGVGLTLEKADLDDKTSIPYCKLNRQGSLRVKVFKKQGETWQGTGDLRGLVSIQVLK